jgi:hypothetical protein
MTVSFLGRHPAALPSDRGVDRIKPLKNKHLQDIIKFCGSRSGYRHHVLRLPPDAADALTGSYLSE